jgi:hypothetical protein
MDSEQGLTKKQKLEQPEERPDLFFSHQKKLKPHHISTRIMDRFRKEEYVELKQDLFSYNLGVDFVDDFFIKHGGSILNWTVIASPSERPLKFLFENVQSEILQKILSADDCLILKNFLIGQSGLEKLKMYSSKTEATQIEKFKFLLKIDPDAVQTFMRESIEKGSVTENIRNNYAQALNFHNNDQKISLQKP